MTRTFTRLISLTATALLAVGLAACGGGGGAPPVNNPPPGGGIDGVGAAIGPIANFGSIFVNGVQFSTSSAQVRIENSPATESQLEVGQIVKVKGRIANDGRTGTAETVDFNDSVEGPVQSVDLTASTLVVLGQTVRVTATTVFDNSFANPSLAGIAVGSVVEVSGFPNGAGEIVATRIEPKAAGGLFELFGVVSSLAGTRFNITTTVVDFATAALPNGSPTNGACVEVKGSVFAGGVLTATRVEVESCTLAVASGDRGEIEGLITRFVSATDFSIGLQAITTTGATVYENGTAAGLGLNVKVEAEGSFNAAGTLVATEIEFEPDNSARLLGTIDSLNAANSSVSIFGVTVLTNVGTSFEDKSSANQRPLNFAALRTGDYLEVRGFEEAAARTMTAVLVEREDLDARRELQGMATSVAQPNLLVLGVSVTTGAGTEFRGIDDLPIDATAFFQQAPNRVVKVRGTWNGSAFAATQAELES